MERVKTYLFGNRRVTHLRKGHKLVTNHKLQ